MFYFFIFQGRPIKAKKDAPAAKKAKVRYNLESETCKYAKKSSGPHGPISTGPHSTRDFVLNYSWPIALS